MLQLGAPQKLNASLAFVALTLLMTGCDWTPRVANLSWVEKVTLSNGNVVGVERHVAMIHERAMGGGASAPVFASSSVEIQDDSSSPATWIAPMMPIVVDKDPENGEWIIVAAIDSCAFWARNGGPRPPYWAFRLREGTWYRDVIPKSFLGRPANLLVDFDVTDSSDEIQANVRTRKTEQTSTTSHSRQYNKIDTTFANGCSGNTRPVGEDELDLKGFRSIK